MTHCFRSVPQAIQAKPTSTERPFTRLPRFTPRDVRPGRVNAPGLLLRSHPEPKFSPFGFELAPETRCQIRSQNSSTQILTSAPRQDCNILPAHSVSSVSVKEVYLAEQPDGLSLPDAVFAFRHVSAPDHRSRLATVRRALPPCGPLGTSTMMERIRLAVKQNFELRM